MTTIHAKRFIALWCLCITLILQPSWGSARLTPKPADQSQFSFAVITDTHISNAAQLARFRDFLFSIQDRNVDFVLILGDICGHAPELLPQIRNIIDHSHMTVYPIPGNHDDNYGQNPDWYHRAFEKSYYAFDHKGWHFVMSDSQIPPPDAWIKKELSAGDGKMPTVFCQHYPPSTMKDHTQMPWAEIVHHRNVKLVLTGHEHIRDTRKFGDLPYEVLNTCFFTDQKGRGNYYIFQTFNDGRTAVTEHLLDDLKLREPADRTPVVSFAGIKPGEILRNGTVLRGAAKDDRRVKKVEYSVDEGPWNAADGTANWNFKLNTNDLADGHHMLYARATDSAGQHSIALAEVMVTVENEQPEKGRVFRFQQGKHGYEGCTDVTVRKPDSPKAADGEEGERADLECWVAKNGKTEFCEFYIRFDLAGTSLPKGARIKRATLTLYGSRQNKVSSQGNASKYFVGIMQEAWNPDMTFATRPDVPAWLCPSEPEPSAALCLAWPYLGGKQNLKPPQPVVIDLTPIKDTVQTWLDNPASNHGLVFSPAAGKDYNMSAKSSRCDIASLRPKLEIEIDGVEP